MHLFFDIGGTKMRAAISKDCLKILKFDVVPTPKDFKKGIAILSELFLRLLENEKIESVTGCIAGVLNKTKEWLFNSPNLSDWVKKPLKIELQKRFKQSVFLENDAALAGLGEAVFGAGKDKNIVAYLTISTGVGGVRIVNNKIDEKVYGFEPGMQIMDILNQKNLEDLVSGKAMFNEYQKPAQEIIEPRIWNEKAKILAYGLHNVSVMWSPDIIVIGGSMMKEVGISLSQVRFYFKKTLKKVFPELPLIKKAALGDLNGICGGMAIVKKNGN